MDPVRAATRDLLRTHGTLDLPDLAHRLVAAGHDMARDLESLDEHLYPFEQVDWVPASLVGGRLADTPTLLEGLVVTTRLASDDVEAGRPWFSPDLDPLLEFVLDDPLPLAGGGALTVELVDHAWELSGPPGWMPGQVGEMLAITVREGVAHVAAMAPQELQPDPQLPDQLLATYDWMRESITHVELPDLVLELRARHPRALSSPQPPLGEIIEQIGLDWYGDMLIRPDEHDEFEAAGDPSVALDQLTAHLTEDHELSPEQVDDFLLLDLLVTTLRIHPSDGLDDEERDLIATARLFAGDVDTADLDEAPPDLDAVVETVGRILADDLIAEAIPHDVLARQPSLGGPLAVLTRRVARATRDRYARSNAWWLHAHALEFLDTAGDETEHALRQALQASRDHVGAAVDLAWHLDDRGHAGAALSLLREHDMAEGEWPAKLAGRWARPGPTSAGRNDPCPCGSGRKHKVCCATTNGRPLQDRVDWVLGKLVRFADRPANAPIGQLLATLCGLDPAQGDTWTDDPIVASMVLFEGGLIEDFCQVRGALLPPDELELLRQWQESTAGLYELVEVEPGVRMTVLDLTTGNRREVVDRRASERLAVGAAILTWLVPYPDGTERIAVGALEIPVHHRPGLLQLLDEGPEAEDLAVWFAITGAPPVLQNTDGDPLVLCRTVLEVPDVPAAVDALREAGLDADEDAEAAALHLLAEDATLLGWVTVEDGRLVAETNSVVRAERLLAVVLGAVPLATVVEDERMPIDEALARRAGGVLDDEDGVPSGALDLDALDPDERDGLVAAMDAFIAEQEQRWVDESIPALGGATPREAAADPTRRGDLLALLDSFPIPPPGPLRQMDPRRLRSLLDL